MKSNYKRANLFLCFDGEGDGDAGAGDDAAMAAARAAVAAGEAAAAAAAKTAAAGDASGGTGSDEDKKFSQADLNRILADDKRKHKEKMQTLEGQLTELSEDRSLSEEQRGNMAKQLEDLRKTYRTKEMEIEYQRKQVEAKFVDELKEVKEKAEKWETKYRAEKVSRSLQDAAAISDAFNPNQIVGLLRPLTELKDMEGELVPMIDFPDIDEKTGEDIKTLRTPADAVKRMKELPKVYGNLFKSNVVSGVGAGQGVISTGEVDYANLTAEQYRKLRADDPERLGLGARRRR